MADIWFYSHADQQHGPITVEALRALLTTNQLAPTDLVWTAGMPDWQPVGQVFANVMPPAAHVAQGPPVAPLGYYNVQSEQLITVGFWSRLVAIVLDSLITGIAGGLIGALIGGIVGGTMGAGGASRNSIQLVATAIGQVLGIILGWLYEVLMTSSKLQATLGKMALGIKVVDDGGNRISFGRATGRHFAKWISGAILCIGYIMAAFTDRHRALHDMIAGTLVVNKVPLTRFSPPR